MNCRGTITLETDRLILRKVKLEDINDMFNNWTNDEEVTRYLTWKPHGTIEGTKSFVEGFLLKNYEDNNFLEWGIELKEAKQLVGMISIVDYNIEKKEAEIGYALSKKYWGLGIMPEAVKKVEEYLKECGFKKVIIIHCIGNEKSGRVALKCGYNLIGKPNKIIKNNDGEVVEGLCYEKNL